MILKTTAILVSVFIIAWFTGYKRFAGGGGEPDSQNVKDSCQGEEQSSILNEFKSDEVAYNESLSDEMTDASLKPSEDVQLVYSKSNISESDVSKSNSSQVNNTTVHVSCILNQTYSGLPVEIVNATRLAMLLQIEANVTNRQIPGHCVVVLFYSPSCPFSCVAAPHFNALQRFFPDIKMVAVDAMRYRSFNTQFGVVGTPTLMIFHSGRAAAKFNESSEYGLEIFAKFITKHTGIEPVGKLMVTSADFGGPISSIPVRDTDYYLLLSWLVIAARILYSFYYSTWGKSLVDATLNAWREAEAQHHHVD